MIGRHMASAVGRRWVAAAGVVALASVAACTAPPDPVSTTTTTTTSPVELVEVDGAQLSWAYSAYAQNGPLGPWSQAVAGSDVSFNNTDGELTSGNPSFAGTRFSVTQFDNGVGAIDPSTGQGQIEWDGEWRLNAYAGQFGVPDETLRDPVLTVDAEGAGTLTFEASIAAGLDSSGNPTESAGPARVPLATFRSVAVTPEGGLRIEPDFAGRSYDSDATESPWQPCEGAGGSWPTEWVDMVPSSLRPHYYSTGCTGLNLNKAPTSLFVNWGGLDPAITLQPTIATPVVTAGATIAELGGHLGYAGNPKPTVQWQVSPDGVTWSDVDGATGLTTVILPDHHGQHLRALVGGSQASDPVGPLTVTYTPVTVNTFNITEVTQTTGDTFRQFSIVGGAPSPQWEWQRSDDDGATWAKLDEGGRVRFDTQPVDATSARRDLYIDALTLDDDGALFRMHATNGFSPAVTSAPIRLWVKAGPPEVTMTPIDSAFFPGQRAVFRATVAQHPTVSSLKWQLSTDSGTTWAEIAGATTATLTLPLEQTVAGNLVRLVATGPQGTTVTDPAGITIVTPNADERELIITPTDPLDPTVANTIQVVGRGYGSASSVTGTLVVSVTADDAWSIGQPIPDTSLRLVSVTVGTASSIRNNGGFFSTNLVIPAGLLNPDDGYNLITVSSSTTQRVFDNLIPLALQTSAGVNRAQGDEHPIPFASRTPE